LNIFTTQQQTFAVAKRMYLCIYRYIRLSLSESSVAIGKLERQVSVCNASHDCGSKQQFNRDHMPWSLNCCLFTPRI